MQEKLFFLQSTFPKMLAELPVDASSIFGKMNVHQMIEHMAWSFQIANGKLQFENKQTPELTAKMYQFMMSDKPFRHNTPNPNLTDNPTPTMTANLKEAIDMLQREITHFVNLYKQNEQLRIGNPFFGELNFAEQVHLLHKHALHHLRQFNVVVP